MQSQQWAPASPHFQEGEAACGRPLTKGFKNIPMLNVITVCYVHTYILSVDAMVVPLKWNPSRINGALEPVIFLGQESQWPYRNIGANCPVVGNLLLYG